MAATRSITLRVHLSRRAANSHVAQALWTTHAEVNAAVRYYEARLLAMRQQAVHFSERQVDDPGATVPNLR